jgi:hypothetical protein
MPGLTMDFDCQSNNPLRQISMLEHRCIPPSKGNSLGAHADGKRIRLGANRPNGDPSLSRMCRLRIDGFRRHEFQMRLPC